MAFPDSEYNWNQSQNPYVSLPDASSGYTYPSGTPPAVGGNNSYIMPGPQRASSTQASNTPVLLGWQPQPTLRRPPPSLPPLVYSLRNIQHTPKQFHYSAYQYPQTTASLISLSDRFTNLTDHYPGSRGPAVGNSEPSTVITPGHPRPEYPTLPRFGIPSTHHSLVPSSRTTFDQGIQPPRTGYNTSYSSSSRQGPVLSRTSFPVVSVPDRDTMDHADVVYSQNANISAASSEPSSHGPAHAQLPAGAEAEPSSSPSRQRRLSVRREPTTGPTSDPVI